MALDISPEGGGGEVVEITTIDGPAQERPPFSHGQAKALPYLLLPWPELELLLKLVAVHGLGWDRVRIYGVNGQTQHGIDIIGVQPDGTYGAIQSKQYQRFDETDLIDAVAAFKPDRLPIEPITRLIVATAARTNRRQIVDTLANLQSATGPVLEFWDASNLDQALLKHADLVAKFFGLEAAKAFCGYTPSLVEPPAPERADLAISVSRGPERKPEIAAALARARKEGVDPEEAAAAYADAQHLLREARFPAHARAWNRERTDALVRAGDTTAAASYLAAAFWDATNVAENEEGSSCARRMASLPVASDETKDDRCNNAAAFDRVPVLKRVLAIGESVARSPIGTIDQICPGLDLLALVGEASADHILLENVARLAVLVAQTAASNPLDTWAVDHVSQLEGIRDAVPQTDPPTVLADLRTALEIEIADAKSHWTALVRQVRVRDFDRGVCATISARAAHAEATVGHFEDADRLWFDAIELACLEGHYDDASEWIFARRSTAFAVDRFPDPDEIGNLQRTAHSLQYLGGGTRQPAIRRAAEAASRNTIDEKTRSSALAARDYARRAYAAGSWRQYSGANTLLALAYIESGDYLDATARLIAAGDGELAVKAAEAAGDEWLDVIRFADSDSPRTRTVAMLVLATQGDLIPDDRIAKVEQIALNQVRAMFVSPSVPVTLEAPFLAGLRILASISRRLTLAVAQEIVDITRRLVERDPGTYRHSDEWHVKIVAGVADTHSELRADAIGQLVGLGCSDSGSSGNVLRHGATVLADYIDIAGPLIKRKVHDGSPQAARLRSRVASSEPDTFSPDQIDEARQRLTTRPVSETGVFTIGSRVVDDALIIQNLPAADRVEVVRLLIQYAHDEAPTKWHAADYLQAASVIDGDLGPQPELFADSLAEATAGFSEVVPPLPSSPLSMVRMTGFETDPRPDAALLAADLATTGAERKAVQEACLRLLLWNGENAHRLAYAIYRAFDDEIGPILPILAAQQRVVFRALAAEAWVTSGMGDVHLGFRLASDIEPQVRRTLARHLGDALGRGEGSETAAAVAAVLVLDPRSSVRTRIPQTADPSESADRS